VGLVTSAPSRISLFFKVDTCGGEPVSGLGAAAFELQEDGRTVSQFESRQRVQPKGERFRLDSVVLLDLSGSVLRGADFSKLEAAAAHYVSSVLTNAVDGQRVALMTFDGRERPQTIVDFTDNAAQLLAGLHSLEVEECRGSGDCAAFADHRTCAGWRCVDDSTNLYGAMVSTLDTLEARLAKTDVPWRDAALVLFTDGTDQASRVDAAVALARAKHSPVHLFSVGLGKEIDSATLLAFGRDGSFTIDRADQLEGAFDAVAARVASLANRFYLLEYCSPRRGGLHTLKVIASVAPLGGTPVVGALTRDFDATGFTSGCDLD
jgi:von Willebrand factor type A domain